jgi:hypothetical protein
MPIAPSNSRGDLPVEGPSIPGSMPDAVRGCFERQCDHKMRRCPSGQRERPAKPCIAGSNPARRSRDGVQAAGRIRDLRARISVTPMGSGRLSIIERACSTRSWTSALPSGDSSASARTASSDSSMRWILAAVLIGQLYEGCKAGEGTQSYIDVKVRLPGGGLDGPESPRASISMQPITGPENP